MVMEIFDYGSSFLNPTLKWIAPILFLGSIIFFYLANKEYGGEFKKGLNLLMISLIVGSVAFFFRVMGDKIAPDFKWGESLFFLIFAILNLVVAFKFLKYVREVKKNVKFRL